MTDDSRKKIICEWCKNSFSTKYILDNHKKRAKYCLKIQGRDDKKYVCDWCSKVFSSSFSLKRHRQNYCEKRYIHKYEKIITKYKQSNQLKDAEIAKLKDKISEYQHITQDLKEKVANKEGIVKGIQIAPIRKTKNVVTKYVNPKIMNISTTKIKPFTVETIKEHVDAGKFTEDIFRMGIRGLGEFVKGMIRLELEDGTIERNYACTDTSRNKFHRFVESEEWNEDNGAHYLHNVLDNIEEPVVKYYTSYLQQRRDATNDIDREYFDRLAKDTEDVFQGVKFKKGKFRNFLFNKLRNYVRTPAYVS